MKLYVLTNPSFRELIQIAKLHKITLSESFLSPLPDLIIAILYFVFVHSTPNLLITLSKNEAIHAFVFAFTATAWPQMLHPSLTGPEIQFICVHPQYQNQGYGSALLKTLTQTLKKHNINSFIVGTKSDNPKSNSFYQKSGYLFIKKVHILGTAQNYYHSPLHKDTLQQLKIQHWRKGRDLNPR